MSNQYILDKLTIIIFTYKRYDYLKRLLEFYNNYDYNFNFLILDSTPFEPNDIEFSIYLKNCVNIKWIKYDESIFFIDKIEDGCKYLETEYSVLCADDDFIFPSALLKSIKFLNNNSDYSSCHGLYYNYKIEYINKNYKLNFSLIYGKRYGGNENTIFNRLYNYLTGKTQYYPFYAVQRTVQFKLVWQYSKIYAKDWAFGEIFPCASILILGKMKIFNYPYSLREPNNFNWYNNERLKKMYEINKVNKSIEGLTKLILNDKTYKSEFISENLNLMFNLLLKNKLKAKTKKTRITRIRLTFNYYYFKFLYKKVLKQDYYILYNIITKYHLDSINISRSDYSSQNS